MEQQLNTGDTGDATPQISNSSSDKQNVFQQLSVIFDTGVSEIRRKSAVTRLNFEIKGFEKEKDKFIGDLGNKAWEAHVEHPDLSGILVNLKELQIESNRLKTQIGEHDTQIADIEGAKTDLTDKFNHDLDQMDQRIVPHRQKIEMINAEKEDNKIQIEEMRSKQDQLSHQIRVHQKNILELDLGSDSEKSAKIEWEKGSIRNIYMEKSEIDARIPFLMANIEKLKLALATEKSEIEKIDEEKDLAKRDYEQRMKDYNQQIHQLEERKKQAGREIDQLRKEMEPFLYDLGHKVEQLRIQDGSLRENFERIDGMNREIEIRNKQIAEAESLSRAMDRSAWTKFLLFSGSAIALVISFLVLLFR